MKRLDVLTVLAVSALATGQAKAAAALDLPPPPAEGACTEKDPRGKELAANLFGCLIAEAQPLFASKVKPEAIADAALAACQVEQDAASALANACHAQPYDNAFVRQTVVSMVEDIRSRADILWRQGDSWQKGACSLDDPTFSAAVSAHMQCMATGDWSKASQIASFGGLAAAALDQCSSKEAPIRERVSQCQGADAAAIMSAFQAAEQQLTTVVALESVLKQAMPKDASKALRADKLYSLREAYDACVVTETKLRAVAGGDAAAILLKAIHICFDARLDLNDYAREHLSPEDSHLILSVADEEAMNMAGFELVAVGLKAKSPSDH